MLFNLPIAMACSTTLIAPVPNAGLPDGDVLMNDKDTVATQAGAERCKRSRWPGRLGLALVALFAVSTGTAATAATLQVAALARFEPVPVDPAATDQDPTFTPDGKTLYFTRAPSSREHVILVTHRTGGTWSAPRVASFSGKWRDLEEVLSPDGKTMIFASNRPAKKGGKALDGFYYNKRRPARGGNLWAVHRIGDKWSEPVRLPAAVNANTSVFSPAIAADGALFFMRAAGSKKSFQIFVSHPDENGAYSSASLAPFDDDRYSNFDPTVAPDGSFVIFVSNRPPAAPQTADLFITWHRNGRWTAPRDLGPALTDAVSMTGPPGEPRLSSDAKTLYYTASKGQVPGRIWRVSLKPLIGDQ